MMARGVELHYSLDGRAFDVMLKCDAEGCADWLGLGFPTTEGQMVGATAVVKLPDQE